jgi:hypothetical protein
VKAIGDGENVVLTMTAQEAQDVEDELLWCPDSDVHSKAVWEALNDLSEGSADR